MITAIKYWNIWVMSNRQERKARKRENRGKRLLQILHDDVQLGLARAILGEGVVVMKDGKIVPSDEWLATNVDQLPKELRDKHEKING